MIERPAQVCAPREPRQRRGHGATTESARVGTLGVPVHVLRRMAKEAGRDHGLAEELWQSGHP